MNDISYRIYPSLLDKFQMYLDSEKEFESHWNVTEDGEYRKTFDEIAEANEKALLDAINRVPFEGDTTAMDKGTCFNEIIDCIVNGKPAINKSVALESVRDKGVIIAHMNEKVFVFDMQFCKKLAAYYCGGITQCYCNATIDTAYGIVELYGYADVCLQDKVIDLKTTKSYTFGEYEKRWQRHVYPFCLTNQGNIINNFRFDVVKWVGGGVRNPVISGDIYEEVYVYNHKQSTAKLRNILERFVEYLDLKKELIIDKKIFNRDERNFRISRDI